MPDEKEKQEKGGTADILQKETDEANAKGYRGTVTDPTPNQNYDATHNDAPTPETDERLAEAARKARGVK